MNRLLGCRAVEARELPLPPALPPPPPAPAVAARAPAVAARPVAERVNDAESRKEWHYCDPSVRGPRQKCTQLMLHPARL